MNKTKYISEEEMTAQADYSERVRKIACADGKTKYCYMQTFGCQQNEADSERIAGMARAMGFEPTETAQQADMIVVNTCAVREHAELKALSITGQFKHLKEKKPELLIGICGCMVSQEHREDDIKHKYPYVDFLFGTSMLYRFPEIVYKTVTQKKRQFFLDDNEGNIAEGMPIVRKNPVQSWVSIMYGCNNFCTYCVVPYVRGRERSRKPACILQEVRQLAQNGCKEITLLGQNVNSYGKDLEDGIDFPDLLEQVCRIEGDFTVRFMTSHPKDASEKLISLMAREPKIAKQFHLPLQSGSDRVLKRMNRKYTREDYLELLRKMRCLMPDITISTDIIVGFPGETEEDFEQTLTALKEARYDSLFSFIYSPRVGTPAASYPDQISPEVKKERFARLLETQNAISLQKNREMIGRVVDVMTEGVSKTDEKVYSGRTNGNKLVHFTAASAFGGEMKKILIRDAEFFALYGEEI